MSISIHAPPRGATGRVVFLSFVAFHFNSRPSARGDSSRRKATTTTRRFQFTPLREGRRIGEALWLANLYFNSRPSARGDAPRQGKRAACTLFQFTPLREGRRDIHGEAGRVIQFQFTPLREGRHRGMVAIRRALISIHAPPRGATHRAPDSGRLAGHFNSRPSARGDSKRYAISANLLFNPYKSAWLNNNATQFVEIILVIFHRIIA